MFNLKKKDAVAEEVAKILAQEAELSPKQKKIAALAGDKTKIDAADFAALRAGKKPVEEGFDDMDKYLKDKNKPQPSGGAGKKQGSKYGGSKQKEEPKEDMKEDVEQIDESDVGDGYKIRMKHSDKGRIHSPSGEHVADVTKEHGAGWRYHSGGKEWNGTETSKHYKTGVEKTKMAAARKAAQIHMNEEVESVDEKAPPGFEGTVKAMKKHKDIDNPFALAWSMKNKGYKSHKKADGSMKKEEVELQTEEDLEEAVSRKHFQQVADLIKTHDDAGKRKELAQHHAEIFKQQNPRFDHAKFMKAAGVNEDINKDRTKDMISGRKPTKQTDDVGPGADGKSTKAKLASEEAIEEASYSAKAARAGKDIGKPGKEFSKIAKSAGKRYGSEEAGKRVAGSILAKLREKKK